jgi:cysteinyl-tRNA synthetase
MGEKHLGETFDIHAGGIDLQFPHHENEIAQSAGAHHGRPLANYWMHNGFLQVEGEKMSKSLGNFITIHDALRAWPGDVLRFNMLRTHYRQPIDWTEASLREARMILDRWYQIVDQVDPATVLPPEFIAALEDDLNLPTAIAEMHKLATSAAHGSVSSAQELKGSGRFLGLFDKRRDEWMHWTPQGRKIDVQSVVSLIAKRLEARKAKNFAEADRIRAQLMAMGVAIKDTPSGTEWMVVS